MAAMGPESQAGGGPPPLFIRMLGPFEARVGGAPLKGLHSRKGYWLLALLALRHGRSVERSWLAGMLWPESPESLALYNLRRELTNLRYALGAEGRRLTSPTPHTLSLDLTLADVDLLTFDRAVAGSSEDELRRALDRYGGPLLEGCAEEWVLPDRVTRAEQYLLALETLAERLLASGDVPAAIAYLRRGVAAEPLRESTHRSLIQALALHRDFPAALQAYRDLRLLLHRELNAAPSVETQELFEQLRREARELAAAAVRPAAGTPVRDPGPVPRLPQPLTELVGREGDAREVADLICSHRLVTLSGTGGVGKSRLALQVAHDLDAGFPDGVWLAELASLADPALLLESVATALGVREDPAQPLSQSLIRVLRLRNGLLVLDNCEHLVDACACFAGLVLRHCPDVRVLVTSRQSLGVFGELIWRVPSLPAPDPAELPSDERELPDFVLRFAAARLFVERASQARPAFRLAAKNARAVAQVSFRLDGIPLALELAAARVSSLPVEEIATRLDDRFRLLTAGSRTGLPRHRTLQATMDWSYHLLTDQERRLLQRLSVFAGGWTLAAAEAVCSGPEIEGWEVLDLLGRLVDRSLVVYEEREEARYRLLESIRQYGQARLREGAEDSGLRDRHLDYFQQLCEQAEPYLFGAVADPAWIRRIARENDNLRAAFEWCEQEGTSDEMAARVEAALRIAAAIHWQWFHLGTLREGRERLTSVLRRRHLGSPAARAKALTAAGLVAFWQGDYGAMQAPLAESLEIFRTLEDDWGTAYTLCFAGAAANFAGEPGITRSLLEEAVRLARLQENPLLVPFALWWFGLVVQAQGDLEAARAAYEECLTTSRTGGSRAGVAHARAMLGGLELQMGDYAAASMHFTDSLIRFQEIADRWGMANVLQGLTQIAAAQADAERAARLGGATEALRERIGASVRPDERELYERAIARARDDLGDESFRRIWDEGRSLPLERAAEYALQAGRRPDR